MKNTQKLKFLIMTTLILMAIVPFIPETSGSYNEYVVVQWEYYTYYTGDDFGDGTNVRAEVYLWIEFHEGSTVVDTFESDEISMDNGDDGEPNNGLCGYPRPYCHSEYMQDENPYVKFRMYDADWPSADDIITYTYYVYLDFDSPSNTLITMYLANDGDGDGYFEVRVISY
ncbi:MAG: hypothetical protein GPJ54_17450 [Candidatus Heimdallarchaeota archaeon]|nr:hypothetical protein [Candidatus Heimdallarchaeota archaeon]